MIFFSDLKGPLDAVDERPHLGDWVEATPEMKKVGWHTMTYSPPPEELKKMRLGELYINP